MDRVHGKSIGRYERDHTRSRCIFGLALGALLLFGTAFESTATFDDASGDKVHATTVVPDPVRKVGEVRLVSRGNAVVVQTLLSTKLLTRAIAEIAKKEAHNWPAPAGAGAAPTETAEYLAALRAADERLKSANANTSDPEPTNDAADAKSAKANGPASSDRRRQLLIEFAADDANDAVLVGTFRAKGEIGHLVVESREVFSTLDLPREYVLREIRLILSDSFDMDESDVDRLGPLGPASTKSASAPKRPVD